MDERGRSCLCLQRTHCRSRCCLRWLPGLPPNRFRDPAASFCHFSLSFDIACRVDVAVATAPFLLSQPHVAFEAVLLLRKQAELRFQLPLISGREERNSLRHLDCGLNMSSFYLLLKNCPTSQFTESRSSLTHAALLPVAVVNLLGRTPASLRPRNSSNLHPLSCFVLAGSLVQASSFSTISSSRSSASSPSNSSSTSPSLYYLSLQIQNAAFLYRMFLLSTHRILNS
ncbi:uncharacterized protein DS421_12g378150 [Arachis hypogaea]|nr:uncharacterized protein DS421_12g378150 [Arachis hypogaea]